MHLDSPNWFRPNKSPPANFSRSPSIGLKPWIQKSMPSLRRCMSVHETKSMLCPLVGLQGFPSLPKIYTKNMQVCLRAMVANPISAKNSRQPRTLKSSIAGKMQGYSALGWPIPQSLVSKASPSQPLGAPVKIRGISSTIVVVHRVVLHQQLQQALHRSQAQMMAVVRFVFLHPIVAYSDSNPVVDVPRGDQIAVSWCTAQQLSMSWPNLCVIVLPCSMWFMALKIVRYFAYLILNKVISSWFNVHRNP